VKEKRSDRQRKHRKNRERGGPIREESNLSRQPDLRQGRARPPAPGAAAADAIDDVVAHGVELGYRVIDEYIRQGQRAAERLNSRGYNNGRGHSSEAAVEDLQELVERLVRYSTSLIPQWVELAGALASAPDLLRDLLRQWDSHPPANDASSGASADRASTADAAASDSFGSDRSAHDRATTGDASADGNRPVSIEVVSSRAARVTLDLRAHSGRLTVLGGGLRAINPEWPPLSEVTFVAGDDGDGLAVRIRVPDEQPAGVYMGVVADAHSGEPCGTLSVRVAAG
jgi:hypothetical protein